MPYQCHWDEEVSDLYHIAMTDKWTWQEFREAIKTSYQMLGALDRNVDIIQAFYSDLPIGSAIMHFTYAGEQPSNIRHTVLLNATSMTNNLFVEFIVDTVDRMKHWQGPKFVQTVEEARTYIKGLRAETSE